MEAIAKLQTIRMTPRKVRLITDQIRNRKITDAITILHNADRRAAEPVLKLLNSAVANAVNNNGMEADQLYVKTTFVNEGPTLKRFRARSHGRVYQILKRTSHITIIVSDGRN